MRHAAECGSQRRPPYGEITATECYRSLWVQGCEMPCPYSVSCVTTRILLWHKDFQGLVLPGQVHDSERADLA